MTLSSQTPSLHVSLFDGAASGTAPNALSEFRVRQLLPQLQAIHEKITGIAGRFVHLVASETAPDAATQQRLAALLTYGDPYQGPLDGEVIVVTPRLGTVSPWASKATDIATTAAWRCAGLSVLSNTASP